MARFRPMLRTYGVSEQQWRILRALNAGGPMRPSDLAVDTLLSAPSLSRLLKSLEARQLIRRASSPDDLRAVRITITVKGRRLVAKISPLSEAIYSDIAAALGARELDQLYRRLTDATSGLGTASRKGAVVGGSGMGDVGVRDVGVRDVGVTGAGIEDGGHEAV